MCLADHIWAHLSLGRPESQSQTHLLAAKRAAAVWARCFLVHFWGREVSSMTVFLRFFPEVHVMWGLGFPVRSSTQHTGETPGPVIATLWMAWWRFSRSVVSASVTPRTAACQGSVKLCVGSVEHRCTEHMRSVVGAPGLQSTGSVVMVHRLSCSLASS